MNLSGKARLLRQLFVEHYNVFFGVPYEWLLTLPVRQDLSDLYTYKSHRHQRHTATERH